ncbi:MAG: hypothetical protein HYX38_26750 [Rhodospirillales bacterium]|nr:hypothetical protein [Rhodospirillales bacterium]
MALKIWIASFIPQNIAGLTTPVPNGGGKTMIPGPTPVSDCFHTDQRSFSDSPDRSSRMRSIVEINPANMTLASQNHHCDHTVECDCEDGDVECDKLPDSSKLKVENFTSSGSKCSFSLTGGAGNPCAGALAPLIEWLVRVSVEKQGASVVVKLADGSLVEPFPAFEMYASLNGTTKKLFQRPPDPGATPWDLFGAPNKSVSGSASFP